MRSAMLLGLLSVLSISAPVHALGSVIVGNQPLSPGLGFGNELLAAVNTAERVYFLHHDWHLSFYFKGGPKAITEALRRFAAIPADKREIILLPAPAKPLNNGKIEYDWCLRVLGSRMGLGRRVVIPDSEIADTRATLTIHIPEPLPLSLADPRKARKWIADLDSDDFKIRDRATKQLADLGPPVASELRLALKGQPAPEARERMERILAGMSRDIRLDVLEFPEGVPVVSLDTLLARARKELASQNVSIRGDAAWYLVNYDAPAEEVLPDLEKLLKTEKNTSMLARAAQSAWHLGAGAKPLLPILRETAKTADKSLANVCDQAIRNIEKATAEPVSEADAKRRATIRKEIREFVAGLKGKADK